MSALFVSCAAGLALLFWSYWGEPTARWFDAHPYDDGLRWQLNQWGAFTLGPILLVLLVYGFRHWRRHGRAAIIVENGALKGPYFDVKLGDIQDMSIGRPDGWESPMSIILRLRDGGQTYLPVAVLTEPGPVVLARLKAVLQNHQPG